MIHCFWDKDNKDYDASCKEVNLLDLENLIRKKKPFEVQILDSEENFKEWQDDMYQKRSISFVANREVLSSSTAYLNDEGKTSKVWIYNLQDKEPQW